VLLQHTVSQEIELLFRQITDPRLLFVHRQLQLRHHHPHLGQGWLRPSSTTDDKVSSPGELHPEALSELDVSLSTHTAPIMEPRRTPIFQ
jgi:hypothetical protein